MQIKKDVVCVETRLRVVPPIFSRGVIFTLARVSLALLSLRKNRGLLVVYVETSNSNCSVHPELNFPSAGSLESCDLTEPFFLSIAVMS